MNEEQKNKKANSKGMTIAILIILGIPAAYYIWAILQTF